MDSPFADCGIARASLLDRADGDVLELDEQFIARMQLQGDVAFHADVMLAVGRVVQDAFTVEVRHHQPV